MTAPPSVATPDGTLRYRTDRMGTTIAVLPATCKSGQHPLVPGIGRMIAAEGEVRVHCPACAATPGTPGERAADHHGPAYFASVVARAWCRMRSR
ncbi:hypothetical protein [Actinokineospora iranica]|uniref:hypothetical protein n=1 Tax=Actinokineospora iranica TaxID=1271860 RepID=UPI0011135BB6|nr:hypothetical protein [Actinokineospora iranica]